jgi:hypothetical protein
MGRTAGLGGWAGRLGWADGQDGWAGRLAWTAGLVRWAGLLGSLRRLGIGAMALFGGGFWHTRCGVVCGGIRERCFGGLPWLSPGACGGGEPPHPATTPRRAPAAHRKPLPLAVARHPHAQARPRPGHQTTRPAAATAARKPAATPCQSYPIQGSELGPFGEQQQGVGAAGRLIGIGRQVPAALTAAGGHAEISGNLVFAHLGFHDRQHSTFLQQVAADADGGC